MQPVNFDYYTYDDINALNRSLEKVLYRNNLQMYKNYLILPAIKLGDYYTIECDLVRLYNEESSERMGRFISGINQLFKQDGNEIHIRFKQKGPSRERKSTIKAPHVKDWEVTFKDKSITDWIIKTLRVALIEGKVPLNIGSQLFNLDLIKDKDSGKYKFNNKTIIPFSYEYARPDTIVADTIANISIELLNLLDHYTPLKFEKSKWITPQLVFIIEVLIVLGFYKSSDNKFVIGSSKPTIDDKKWLRRLLDRKAKQGLIIFQSETVTTTS